ncbi:MAG: LysE family translocator [Deltaproteobacteria bacterium]|nr:LysE family translocator [Deltaproteobacteria bacterium]
MAHSTQLWLFFVLVFGVILLPGLDMAFVLGSAIVGGRRAGFSAVFGIMAGGAVHVTAGTLGISALLAVSPSAFNVVLLAGAAYVAWVGVSLLRSHSGATDTSTAQRTRWQTFRQAAVTCLLNPKAYVFMLAVFPQFLRPQDGHVAAQALVLGLIIAATQLLIYGAVALSAGTAQHWLASRPVAQTWMQRTVGGVLLASAVLCAVQGVRGL